MPHKDPEKYKEWVAKYRAKNRERIREYVRNWARRNMDKIRAYEKEYLQTEVGKKTAKRAQAKYRKTKKSDIAQERYHKSAKGQRYLLKNRLDKYGLTALTYAQMYKDQKGLCAICEKPPTTELNVDHNHHTKKVRGLLCRDCNLLLAQAFDDVDILLSAIQYLRKAQMAETEKGAG